jgi:hypothetical protein
MQAKFASMRPAESAAGQMASRSHGADVLDGSRFASTPPIRFDLSMTGCNYREIKFREIDQLMRQFIMERIGRHLGIIESST